MEFDFKSSLFEKRNKLLINIDLIEFCNWNSTNRLLISKSEIEAFRYGIRWIRGIEFVIGRIYCIDIMSKSGEKIKIRLKSLYGINRKVLFIKYVAIVEELYNNYFDDISNKLINQVINGEEYDLSKIIIKKMGIHLKRRNVFLTWDDIETRAYSRYFAIYSKSKPEIYQTFEYLEDWNTGVVFTVISNLLENYKLIQNQ